MGRRHRGVRLAAFGALALWAFACGERRQQSFATLAAGGSCGTVYLEGVEDAFDLVGDLSTPGTSPQIVFESYVPGAPGNQILLTRTLILTLPAQFGFQGFDALGASAAIASWDFDFSNPGNGSFDPISQPSDYRIPIYAIDADEAYVDALLDGAYDVGEPTASYAAGPGGSHVFTVLLPSGGTDNGGSDPDDPCSYFDTDTRFTLAAGIVTLPASPGSYDVEVHATSVDPDTGDADDSQGTSPSVYTSTFAVTVPEPGGARAGGVALAALLAARRLGAWAPRRRS